jgi:ComF family protein
MASMRSMQLIDLVLPPTCVGCGRASALLCQSCRGRILPPGDPTARFVLADPGVIVGDDLTLALAAFRYDGVVMRALRALKYGGVRRIAPFLAEAALPTLDRLVAVSGPTLLVPVPAHPARERARGYNQAALLATALGRISGVPSAELLTRTRDTLRMHRLDRAGRLRNLREAFATSGNAPACVTIVDDIATTSATLEACAAALRAAGAEEVYGLAIAREV